MQGSGVRKKIWPKCKKKLCQAIFFLHSYFSELIFLFLTPWAGQARLAGQAKLAALAPAGPIWSPTAGGLARQALSQFGGRRLHGKRDNVKKIRLLMVSTLGDFVLSPAGAGLPRYWCAITMPGASVTCGIRRSVQPIFFFCSENFCKPPCASTGILI